MQHPASLMILLGLVIVGVGAIWSVDSMAGQVARRHPNRGREFQILFSSHDLHRGQFIADRSYVVVPLLFSLARNA
jgi:hypothetical protein